MFTFCALYLVVLASWCNIEFVDSNANPMYYAKKLYINGELLEELVVPNTVTEIKSFAFYYCTSLTSVTIGDSVTSIGNDAFYGCSSLSIYCVIEIEPSGWSSSWNDSKRPVTWGYRG